nr:glycosyltransferase family 2 protein [uncultured Desulfobacter sp.]
MDISFVILTWNSGQYIGNCLNSIWRTLKGSCYEFEILIVDNGSSDNTRTILSEYKKRGPLNLTTVLLNENRGTTVSRNIALKEVTGTYVCISDSDIEFFPGTIEGLIATLKQNKKSCIVAPQILYPSGKLQKSTDQFPTVTRKLMRYLFLKKMEQKEAYIKPDCPVHVDYAISACWMMDKKVINAVGLLDERIFYAPEDADYCLRAWKAGVEVIYTPLFKIIHHTQEISRGFKLNQAFINHIAGLLYYFKKHKYCFARPKVRGLG